MYGKTRWSYTYYFDSDIDDPNVEVFATSEEDLKVLIRIVTQLPKRDRPHAKRLLAVVTESPAEEKNKEKTEKEEKGESN